MTTILTVRVASTGADNYVLTRYSAEGGGQQTWSGRSMPLHQFADLVASWAQRSDFVCLDESGLGAALVDMLAQRGIGVLLTHRMQQLEG